MTDTANLADLARQMKEIGKRKDELEEQLKSVNKEWDEIRKVKIPEAMAAIDPDLSKVSIAGLGTVYLRTDIYAGIRDKDIAFQWLEWNGYQDLIQPQIHPSTLKAWMKEQLKEGIDLPECFKFEAYSYAVILK